MQWKRLFWSEGRFSWWFVGAFVLGTAFLLWFDWYWRTHETNFSSWF